MAQHDFVINNQGFPSFRSDLNDFLNAVRTSHSGTSLPSGAVAGTIWLDTTSATTPILKYYDGTDNITLATINHATNTVDFNDSSISTPLTITGNATAGAEIRLPEDTDNGTNFVALKAPDSIASNLTLTLPSADGTVGQVLTTSGAGVLSFTSPSAGIAFQSSIKTANFNAVAGEGYFCNTTSGAFTVTLPSGTPTLGNQIALVDYAGTFDTNALTINPNGNKIEGATANLQLTGEREGVLLTFTDATQGWLPVSGINEGTDALEPVPYTVDFLVIAGGGSGASGVGLGGVGGGGAGGYRNSFSTETSGGNGSSEASLSFLAGVVYTVTVGAGGSSAQTQGIASSISGTGISTISSTGGGRGTGGSIPSGLNGLYSGGSGGGGNGDNNPSGSGSGTANQGFAGGTGTIAGSGGGGAGAQGGSGNDPNGGAGGVGLSSSITGSGIFRAGGGGGSTGSVSATGGAGGNGGGGAGSTGDDPQPTGTAGTVNTGGGGGGSRATGGAGGKGVVILRMPTANYSGTTTGSPTVTTDGSDKVIVFNDSGSITG